MQAHPHPMAHTLHDVLLLTRHLERHRVLRIADRERRCRWVRALFDMDRDGLTLMPHAKGRVIRCLRDGDLCIEFDLAAAGPVDLVLGFDTLRPTAACCPPHPIWRLPHLDAPPAPSLPLHRLTKDIAYASTGSWRRILVAGALDLRKRHGPAGRHAHHVVHALSSAADGWAVHAGLDAILQVGVREIVTAATPADAERSAGALWDTLHGRVPR